MINFLKSGGCRAAVCGAAMAVMASGAAHAEADNVSADMAVSYNSHFISYGADVWGAGDEFFGSESTWFLTGSATFQIFDPFSINVGIWTDVNDNVGSAIGGTLQEVDVWVGGSLSLGIVTAGITYQAWIYAGDTEKILDFTLDLDDSEFLGDFALSPSFIWHVRTDGNGAQEEGSVIQLSVSPGFDLIEDALSVSIPAGIAFFLTDDFQGGTDGGYGYSYLGVSFGVPLSFIPGSYGDWAFNFDVIGYFTDDDAIPGNPEENFVTGSFGISVAF